MTNEAAQSSPASPVDTQAVSAPADTQAPTPVVGTDGKPPVEQSQDSVQTTPEPKPAARGRRANVTKPEADAPSPAQTQTPEQIIEAHEAKKAADLNARNLKEAQDALREFRRTAPVTARDLMDKLGEELGVLIPVELRKPFLDLIEEHGLKGEASAKLQIGEEATTAAARSNRVLAETSNAFYDSLDGEEDMDAFAAAVEGKPPAQWPAEFAKIQRAYGEADAVATFAELGAERLGEAARGKFTAAIVDADTIEQVVDALLEAASQEGNERPVGQSRLNVSGGAMGRYRDLDALNAAKQAGSLSDVEYLAEQNRLLGVS